MHRFQQNDLRGFTLLELLVVIAIIGILSSVVLASLNSARGRGVDASLKSTLKSAQTQAELYYLSNGNYTNLCTTPKNNGGVLEMVEFAEDNSSMAVCRETSSQSYDIYTQLESGRCFIVDSSGGAGEWDCTF